MKNMKKVAVGVFALVSGYAFSGTMGPACTQENVTTPCEKTAWEIGAYGIDLQPSLGTPFDAFSYVPGTTLDQPILPNWNWGFNVEAGYHFGSGKDINLNWYQNNGNATMIENGKFKSNWDAANAELGQSINLSSNQTLRVFGGVQYARIYTDIRDSTSKIFMSSLFNGFGPRAGMDMKYNLATNFGIYAKAATALLTGNSSYNVLGLLGGYNRRVIAELEAKLGADYTYEIAQGAFTVDAGYMWFNYFNAVQGLSANTLADKSNSVSVKVLGDYSASGPYVGLKYVGNV